MGKIIFLFGGARSGKSTKAEQLAAEIGGDSVLFVATAEAKDKEMADRIKKHKADRPATWNTLEEPIEITGKLKEIWKGEKVILVDCMTLLTTNILLSMSSDKDDTIPFDAVQSKTLQEVESFLAYVSEIDTTTIIISNEVGLGLVPPYLLGRVYRDILGRVNQLIAAQADKAIFMAAGLELIMKQPA